ncbi:predicted protein [Chaetoceros tenuissimus]|uniref:Uncharacterized protein n=1 Tax=Chaetoceros tenuissimus TaxID=426638 RepID=A0AAD3H2H1_9STRA|nr:predicted protein [Chaetoceros tenuissimus]
MKISVQAVQCFILSSLLVDKAVSFAPTSIKASSFSINRISRSISKTYYPSLNSSKNDNDESTSSSSSSGTKVVNELVSLFETVNTKQQNYDTENARLKFQLNDILSKYDQTLQDQIALQDTSNALQGQIDTLTQRMQILQAEADRNLNLLQTRNDAMKLLETQKLELEKQLRVLESEQTLRLQTIATVNQEKQKLQEELKQQQYESQEILKSKEKEYEFQSSRIKFQLEEMTTKYEQAKKDQYVLQDIVDSLKRMKQELNEEIVQLKKELQDNRQTIENKDTTISDLQQRISSLETSLKDMENEKTMRLKEIAMMNQEMEKLQVQVSIQETQLFESQKDANQVAARITGEAETEKFKLQTKLSAKTREMDDLKQKMQSMNQEILNVKREADEKIKKMEIVSKLVQKDLEAKSREEKRKIKQKMWKIATQLEDEKLKVAVMKQKYKDGETKQKAEYEQELKALEKEKSKITQDLQYRLDKEEAFYEQAKEDFTQALKLLQSDYVDQESILEAIEADESQKVTKNLLEKVTSARSKKLMEDLEVKYATDISSLEEALKKEREANAKTKKELEKTIQELTNDSSVQQDISTNQLNALKTAMTRKIEELEEQAKAKEMFYAKAKMDFAKNLSKYSKKVTYLEDTLESERNFNSITKVKLQQKVERLTQRNSKLEATSTETLKKLKTIEKKYDEEVKILQDTLENERRSFEEERERLEKQISDMSIKFAQEKKQLEDGLTTQLVTTRKQFQQEIENVKQALEPRISDLAKELNETKENARSEINELKVNHTIELETSKKIANKGKIKIEELVAERDELIKQSEEKSIEKDSFSENNNAKRRVDMDKMKEKLKEIEVPSSQLKDVVPIETKLEMNKIDEDSTEVTESTEKSKVTEERMTDRNKTTGLYDKLINKQKSIIRRKAIRPDF